ncbi:hypothetical protein AMTR_s00062p00214090 [Amborella trichopoda]|uniref:Uncharacterized protein n=1 Tax=Amborella trichopoda TaxID=13333 RepID=U5DE82_AMBTC|nr:hypothetical protein AMTR_s00062p00214090 [Amborella trichopoda]
MPLVAFEMGFAATTFGCPRYFSWKRPVFREVLHHFGFTSSPFLNVAHKRLWATEKMVLVEGDVLIPPDPADPSTSRSGKRRNPPVLGHLRNMVVLGLMVRHC